MNVLLVFHPQNTVFVWVYPQKGTFRLKHPEVSKKGFYSPIYEIKPIKNLMSKYKVPYYISPFNERVVTVIYLYKSNQKMGSKLKKWRTGGYLPQPRTFIHICLRSRFEIRLGTTLGLRKSIPATFEPDRSGVTREDDPSHDFSINVLVHACEYIWFLHRD